jgi:glycosyltransferase involved in cell wall biosynthesis
MKEVLIAMAVHNTEENKRFETTYQCITKLLRHLMSKYHEINIINNGSTCVKTNKFLERIEEIFIYKNHINVISQPENIGTAAAINQAWRHRKPGQHCIKMDNDVIIHSDTWIDDMVEAIEREPNIGIIGLKRKDCWEHPAHVNPDLRSQLIMLPKKGHERWMIVERVFHVMGTCQMYNSALLDKIGYLYQPGLYGYDDVLAAHRCHKADMWSVFLPHIDIDHIDPGDTPYQTWKERTAGEKTNEVVRIAAQYRSGERSIYYNPFE